MNAFILFEFLGFVFDFDAKVRINLECAKLFNAFNTDRINL